MDWNNNGGNNGVNNGTNSMVSYNNGANNMAAYNNGAYNNGAYNAPYGARPAPAAPVNDTAPMVFGIVSLASGWFLGIPGIIFGILALVKSGSVGRRTGKVTAAKITGGIGLGLGIFWFIMYMIYFIAAAAALSM